MPEMRLLCKGTKKKDCEGTQPRYADTPALKTYKQWWTFQIQQSSEHKKNIIFLRGLGRFKSGRLEIEN